MAELFGRGVDPDSFLPRFSFFFNCHSDFFEEIAKLRAARRLWARLMRERFGAKDPRSWQLRTHTQTSGVSLTAQQPLTNIARTAIEALAGILGGTQSLHTNSYDETYAIPTLEAATIALRTQQILAFETGVASVADPLGGSWFVEQLTDEMEAQAVAYLDEIDRRGGMVAAVEQGYPQSRDRRGRATASSSPSSRASASSSASTPSPSTRCRRSTCTAPTPRSRPASWSACASCAPAAIPRATPRRWPRSHAACAGTDNVMPHLIEAGKAGATLGEMCDVFRETFGVYRDPGRF